jgi:hypothetical protein
MTKASFSRQLGQEMTGEHAMATQQRNVHHTRSPIMNAFLLAEKVQRPFMYILCQQ